MTNLPTPKEHEEIHTYLNRLGYFWADLWQIEDVLIEHGNYDCDKTEEENHELTDISREQAIDILKTASSCIDHSGDGLHGYALLRYCLDEVMGG